jgi:hypothetical protein
MCWRSSKNKQTQLNIINEKNNQIEKLNKDLSRANNELSNLTENLEKVNLRNNLIETRLTSINNELRKSNIALGEQKVINEALKDKINEMNIDNLDKDTLIDELTNRYKIELEKLRSQLDIYKKTQNELRLKNNTLSDELSFMRNSALANNIIIYYFVGYNYKKDKVDLEYDVKTFMENKISEVHIQFDNSMYNSLENIKLGKNLHKIRTTKKNVKEAFDNIIGDLKNGKKTILIGENYGGAIVNRLLDMLILEYNTYDINILNNLTSFTFGSFYNPDRHLIQKNISKYINSNQIFNYIYKEDLVTKYDVGEIPKSIDNDSWSMNTKNFLRWKSSEIEDQDILVNSYDVLSIVKSKIKEKGII